MSFIVIVNVIVIVIVIVIVNVYMNECDKRDYSYRPIHTYPAGSLTKQSRSILVLHVPAYHHDGT